MPRPAQRRRRSGTCLRAERTVLRVAFDAQHGGELPRIGDQRPRREHGNLRRVVRGLRPVEQSRDVGGGIALGRADDVGLRLKPIAQHRVRSRNRKREHVVQAAFVLEEDIERDDAGAPRAGAVDEFIVHAAGREGVIRRRRFRSVGRVVFADPDDQNFRSKALRHERISRPEPQVVRELLDLLQQGSGDHREERHRRHNREQNPQIWPRIGWRTRRAGRGWGGRP